jgi:hypothetical protein
MALEKKRKFDKWGNEILFKIKWGTTNKFPGGKEKASVLTSQKMFPV